MVKAIEFALDTKSINKAIKELKKYERWVEQKSRLLEEKLAVIGANEARIRFTGAYYDGTNDAEISVFPDKNGWVIKASGQSVCFIEFGAGVYYNGSEPYPNPRPAGVVGIGEYGQGKGKRDGWFFNRDGDPVFTRGTPAAMPMYHAAREMERSIRMIAQEVFKN